MDKIFTKIVRNYSADEIYDFVEKLQYEKEIP